jgi:O-antigen/teichoic acid export membrane protein
MMAGDVEASSGGVRRIAASLAARVGHGRLSTLFSLADQGVVSLTTFLTGVLVARFASKEELGLYAIGFSCVLVAGNVQQALVSLPYMVHGAKVPEAERAAYAGSSLLHQLAVAALTSAALAIGAWVAHLGGASSALTLLVVAAAVPFTLARDFARHLLFVRLRFASALALDATVAGLQLAVVGSLAWRGLLTARSAYAAIGAACAVGALAAGALARRSFEVRPARAAADFRANWATARWSLASGLVGILGGQVYPWFLVALRGAAEAGAFAACAGIAFIANPLLLGLGNALAPRILHAYAARGAAGLREAVRQGTLLFGGVMCVVSPTLLVAGGFLLNVVYGARYQEYGLTVGLLSLAQAVEVTSWPLSSALFAVERARAIVVASVVSLGLALTVGVALVRSHGPTGVACALLLVNAVSLAYRWRAFRRHCAEVAA